MILKCTVITLLWLAQSSAFAGADSTYLAELTNQARKQRLAERPEWLKLGHYLPKMMAPGYKGLVDSQNFYLAVDGKANPQSEMEATLASFFSDVQEKGKTQNPQCAFIARYTWLNAQLKFDAARLPPRSCKLYEQWRALINPSGLTLIFSSAYLNSPSSMYGHTLLRVDAQDQDEHTRLLAYAVNFAANTQESNGIVFAVNGLFGGYAGTFSMMPYYIKVREYSDFENRDMWEYQLNFTPEEVNRVLQHIWEFDTHYFDYYFFDENCSYHLLGLLQVARPEFDFTRDFRWGAVPSDTVREITSYPDLVSRVVYRPANATLLRNQFGLMDAIERKLALALSRRELSATDPALHELPLARQAVVLETSLDYLNYRQVTGHHDVGDPAVLARELQGARSRIDIMAPLVDTHEPKVKPDEGHRSSRITMGAGNQGGRNFQEVQLRATYHDLMDREDGYVHGAEIEFFSMALRHYDSSDARVEQFTPVKILSLAPRDEFFYLPSWKVSGGWKRVVADNGSEPLAGVVDGGLGGAWSGNQNNALSYIFLDVGTRFNDSLNKGYALGAGTSVGSYIDVNETWRVHPYLKVMSYFSGQQDVTSDMGVQQRVSLTRDVALRVDISRHHELQRNDNLARADLLIYF